MANSVHTVICPYFRTEFNTCVTCEDVRRSYPTQELKDSWMFMYCDTWEWEKCPYAVDLTEAYYRQERGDDEAVERNKTKALEKEINSLSKRLGRAEKRAERLAKVNELMHQKMDKAVKQLEEYKQTEARRYFDLAQIYEARIAYLIDTYCEGRLAEADVRAWAEGKEYALTFDRDAEERIWVVMTREESEADDTHNDRGVSGDAESDGREAEEQVRQCKDRE